MQHIQSYPNKESPVSQPEHISNMQFIVSYRANAVSPSISLTHTLLCHIERVFEKHESSISLTSNHIEIRSTHYADAPFGRYDIIYFTKTPCCVTPSDQRKSSVSLYKTIKLRYAPRTTLTLRLVGMTLYIARQHPMVSYRASATSRAYLSSTPLFFMIIFRFSKHFF